MRTVLHECGGTTYTARMGLPATAALVTGLLAIAEPSPAAAQAQGSHLGRYVTTIEGLARPVAVEFAQGPEGDLQLWIAEEGSASTPPRLRWAKVSASGEAALAPAFAAGSGTLRRPSGVACGRNGQLFAVDSDLHQVLRLDGADPESGAEGTWTVLANKGDGPGEVLFPADVEWRGRAAGQDLLAVADAGNRRVQVLDLSSGEWRVLPRGDLVVPTAARFVDGPDGSTRIAIADGCRHRLGLVELDGSPVRWFSDWGSFPSLVSSPSALASADGFLFVADTENHRVQAFDPAEPLPLRYRFGVHAIRPGEGEGRLHYPTDLSISADASLLALPEPLDGRVQVFTRAPGAEPKEDPTRVGLGAPGAHLGPDASASGTYLVTYSPESSRVQVHDLRGDGPVRIAEIFGYGTRLGMLQGPAGVWLTDNGRTLLVTDTGARRLTRAHLKVRPSEPLTQDPEVAEYQDGLHVGELRGEALEAGDWAAGLNPKEKLDWLAPIPGAVCSQGDQILVADRANQVGILLGPGLEPTGILRADADSLPIASIGGVHPAPSGGWLVVDRGGKRNQRFGRVLHFRADGSLAGEFGRDVLLSPDAVVCRGSQVFVSDPLRSRIESFKLEGESAVHVGGFGSPGLGRAEFNDPRGLAVLGDGRLIVIDHGSHRGQIFDAEGNFLEGFGGRLYTNPLRAPR